MREQITDGENGFLVEDGDVPSLADRMVTLADDPELVDTMSRAARRRAREHGPERVLADWARAFARVRDQARSRTRISECVLTRVRLGQRRTLPRGTRHLRLDATLRLVGSGPRPDRRTVSATLDVVDDVTGDYYVVEQDVGHAAATPPPCTPANRSPVLRVHR